MRSRKEIKKDNPMRVRLRDHSKKLAFIAVLAAHAAALILVERTLRLQHSAGPGPGPREPPPLLLTFTDVDPSCRAPSGSRPKRPSTRAPAAALTPATARHGSRP